MPGDDDWLDGHEWEPPEFIRKRYEYVYALERVVRAQQRAVEAYENINSLMRERLEAHHECVARD